MNKNDLIRKLAGEIIKANSYNRTVIKEKHLYDTIHKLAIALNIIGQWKTQHINKKTLFELCSTPELKEVYQIINSMED